MIGTVDQAGKGTGAGPGTTTITARYEQGEQNLQADPVTIEVVGDEVTIDEADVRIMFVQRECNYLQALEGDIDTSHFGFLHAGGVNLEDISRDQIAHFNLVDRRPEYQVAETDWGTMYGAHRPAGPGQTYWRFAQFFFPFWTMPPDGDFADHIIARAWVPMDDTHTMFVHISWLGNKPGLRTDKAGVALPGMKIGRAHV